MHQYLVVANHTLGGQELLDTIRNRMSRGPAEFWVLVPATPDHLIWSTTSTRSAAPSPSTPDVLPSAADDRSRDQGVAEAQAKLDTEVQRLREIGATADGAVGDPDPMSAIETTLAERQFDEILLSTLPPGLSRWLAWDLPHRVRRRTSVPLTVITCPKPFPSRDELDGSHVRGRS